MIECGLIISTFLMLFLSIKKAGYIPFPTGLIFILGMSQLFFALAHEGIVYYSMLALFDYGGVQKNYTIVQAIYSFAAFLSLFMLVGKFDLLKKEKIDPDKIKNKIKTTTSKRAFAFMLILVSLHLLLFFAFTDWDALWIHPVYLQSLVDQEMANYFGNMLTATIIRTTPLWAILSVLCIAMAEVNESPFSRIFAWLLSICYFFILFSLHSRSAALVPALIATNYVLLRLRGRNLMIPIMAVICLLTLSSALTGRGASQHGLSTIPASIMRPFASDNWVNFTKVVLDSCQGIFITAESLQIKGAFPQLYKTLAFSPLPSFIDGYSSIMTYSEHRLHVFVPMSGIGEAINFGWPYVFVLIALFSFIARLHIRLADKSPMLFLLCNFLIMFAGYKLFSYPLRNALRADWLAFYIVLLTIILMRRPKIKPYAGKIKIGVLHD